MGSACLGIGTHVDNPQPLEENSSDAFSCSVLHQVMLLLRFLYSLHGLGLFAGPGWVKGSYNHVLWLGLGMSCGVPLSDPRETSGF